MSPGTPAAAGWLCPANVWVAGDLSLEGGIPRDQPASFALDEFSLLARWDATARLALFGELRLGDQIIFTEGEGWDTSSLTVALERLYAEAILTPRLTLRVGKVFTPFGLWNVTNRGPFTWTVDGPAVVEGLFPIHATGLSLHHQTNWNGWSIDGVAYGPAQDEPPLRPTNERGWLVGGRVAAGRNLGSAFASIGLNLASFRPRDRVPRRPVWSTATGVDLDLSVGGHSVTGELAFRTPAGGGRTAHGMYFQDAIPLDPWLPVLGNLHAVGRFEYFQAPRGATALGAVFGLFWIAHRGLPGYLAIVSNLRARLRGAPS